MSEPIGYTNREAERSVIGAMLLAKRAIWDVLPVVNPADYDDGRLGDIHRAIAQVAHRGEPVDQISVADELRRVGMLEKVGGAPALHELTAGTPTAANAGFYADIVRRNATIRRLRNAGTAIIELAGGEGDPDAIVEEARQLVDTASTGMQADVHFIGDRMDAMIDSLGTQARYHPTPWHDINRMILGFHPGRLYIIGARPGSGKSIMGAQAAMALAQYGQVAFSSLEMDESDLIMRMIAAQGSVHLSALSKRTLTPPDWERVAKARSVISALPIAIDDRSGVSMTQIRAHARTVSRKGELTGVIVDYLQLIPSPDARKARWEHVGEISRALKIMARELDVPVIALCQLNRETDKQKRLPTMADLRESGSIEQDADVILLLQRRQDEEGENLNELDVVVAKNRHGPMGRVELLWEGGYGRVTSYPDFEGRASDARERQAGNG